jgi:hypothetical protein
MGTSRKTARWTAAVIVLIAMIGCGGPAHESVEGKVTLDGGAVDGGTISFLPTVGQSASGAWGHITAGTYSLPTGKGPVAGTYRVEIRWMRKTGRMVSGYGTQAPEMASVIPERFNQASELKVSIKPGKNQCDFALTSR